MINGTAKSDNNVLLPVAKSYRMCARCVMDISDPLIMFDSSGVCNHCHAYDNEVSKFVYSGVEGERKLSLVVESIKQHGVGRQYDCLIGVSGGVDSTFVAWKVKQLGLRPLAVHLDNGWDSEIAVRNIHSALTRLGIDLHTEVLDWEQFKDIQLAFLRASTPDAEIPSDHAIFATMFHTARRLGIRYVVSGVNVRTETHLPSTWSQGHFDWGYIKAVHRRFGTHRRIGRFPHFGLLRYLNLRRGDVQTIDLLNYVDYSKKDALHLLQTELGWKDYGGKHHESVYTRWYQGCYLPRKFGYDKRRSHLSSLVCSGEITRDEALKELDRPPYSLSLQEQDCEYVAKKFGLTTHEFDAIMAAPHRRFEEFSSYARFHRGQWFQRLRWVYHTLSLRKLRRP